MLGNPPSQSDAGPPVGAPRPLQNLVRGFATLIAVTSGLIVLGALVRAHEAGLACPDWPLCFGELVPAMNLQVAFEWTHRAVAGGVLIVFVLLAVRVLRQDRLPCSARPLLGVAAALLALQVLLGALTVWQRLAAWSVTAHLLTGNAFNASLLLLALELRSFPGRAAAPGAAPAIRVALVGGFGLLLLQIALGGLVSSTYAGLACPTWPACHPGSWFPSLRGSVGLHLAHRWNAVLLIGALALCAAACRRLPRLRRLAALALTLGLLQLGAGIANVLAGIPVEITALHSALAALLVLCQVALLHEAFRAHG